MVSSLTNQGKLRYMVYKGGMNAKLFKVFLKRLIKDNVLESTALFTFSQDKSS